MCRCDEKRGRDTRRTPPGRLTRSIWSILSKTFALRLGARAEFSDGTASSQQAGTGSAPTATPSESLPRHHFLRGRWAGSVHRLFELRLFPCAWAVVDFVLELYIFHTSLRRVVSLFVGVSFWGSWRRPLVVLKMLFLLLRRPPPLIISSEENTNILLILLKGEED